MRKPIRKQDPKANPFLVLLDLDGIINGHSIPGISRSPTQRLAAARLVLREWKTANAAEKARGNIFFLGEAP